MLNFPKIVTYHGETINPTRYHAIIRDILNDILPPGIFLSSPQASSKLKGLLPLITMKSSPEAPENISFYCMARLRPNSFKFFFEMISRWLIPGERLNVMRIYASDFCMPELSSQVYTICEILVREEESLKRELIKNTFPLIETEIRLGIESKYYAEKILEMKGLSSDDKTAMIQNHIAAFLKRRPDIFDQHIFAEMQNTLLVSPEAFKKARPYKHLSRLILTKYLFKKQIGKNAAQFPGKRHIYVKLFSRHTEEGQILSVIVGMNHLREKEIFAKSHLIKALTHFIGPIEIIDDSYLASRRSHESVSTVYIEFKKCHGRVSQEEKRLLETDLPKELKSHVEHFMHPIFMPRNEEEIMRNMLSLSQQIKYTRDLPQVFISFDQQSRGHLFFSVIVVRLLKGKEKSLAEMFKSQNSFLKYIHDRTKLTGFLRNKYQKQATVFRVKFPKDEFFRLDHSIDLYKARKAVVNELISILGEFRDFNGGMISKQSELFLLVKESLVKGKIKFNHILFENFFYSLSPVVMQTILEPAALNTLFLMMLEQLKRTHVSKILYKIKADSSHVYGMVLSNDRMVTDELERAARAYDHSSTELALVDLKVQDTICLGMIFRSSNESKRAAFTQALEQIIESLYLFPAML